MGTTFVTISNTGAPDEPGFWMHDAMLELWLRLLALHLPEPTDDGEHEASLRIRNRWLLASRGYFVGCVPHEMPDACSTDAGRAVVRLAVQSLLAALRAHDTPLHGRTLDLLGIDGQFTKDLERAALIDVGRAFLDLMDGALTSNAASAEIMPGSKPYRRGDAAGD